MGRWMQCKYCGKGGDKLHAADCKLVNELFGEDEPDDRVTCNRCGATGLHWQEIVKADGSQGSKLFTERNRPHVCQESSADAFGKVPE